MQIHNGNTGNKEARGFTLIELLIALSVMVIIAAVATPSIMQAWNSYRLTTAANSVATLLQRTRFEAIHRNNTIACLGVQNANVWQLGIDQNRDNAINGTEPQVVLPGPATIVAAGAPAPASMGAAYTNAVVPAGAISFNARGTVPNVNVPYVTYIEIQGQPQYGFRAVTVTPMGQVKVWTAQSGGNWIAE